MAPKNKPKQDKPKEETTLGLLKYRANPSWNNKAIDMEDAQNAWDSADKRNFVADFKKAVSRKNIESLKFYLIYKNTIAETKHEEVATTEDYLTMRRIMASGANVSKIFWVLTTMFTVDWLHAVGQGVAADFAGNFLLHLIKGNKLRGVV